MNGPQISQQQIADSLIAITNAQNMSRLQKAYLNKKTRVQAAKGQLSAEHLLRMDRLMAWRFCSAELYHGRTHWLGWESRSEEMLELATRRWFYPRWTGKPCKLLVMAEGGLGEEIMASSCFTELLTQNEDTHIECDSRLIPIFELTFSDRFPKARFFSRWKPDTVMEGRNPTTEDSTPIMDHRGEFDAFIPAMHLLKLLALIVQDRVRSHALGLGSPGPAEPAASTRKT